MLGWLRPGGHLFTESCNYQSGNHKRDFNPTHYRSSAHEEIVIRLRADSFAGAILLSDQMASNSIFQEEDLLCPVCYDVFRDPVVLPCSHSACKTCMEEYWEHKDHQECPICRKRSSNPLPPVSLTLKKLCEVVLQAKSHKEADIGSEKLCGRHKEKLKLFCLKDEQPVCLVCRDSRLHKGHTFCPIDEVPDDYKLIVEAELEILKEKLRLYNKAKQTFDETKHFIEMQADEATVDIKIAFEILHQHLHEQENARIDALRKEEKEKNLIVEVKIKELSKIITSLSNKIQVVEDALNGDPVAFLQRYKTILYTSRAQCKVPDPQLGPRMLIDVAEHLGNLKFCITQDLQKSMEYYPVVLDPNTAHKDVFLDLQLKEFRMKDSHDNKAIPPDTPERFSLYPWVLGSKGFDSGFTSWEVEVKDTPFNSGKGQPGRCGWTIGLLEESVSRQRVINKGLWNLSYNGHVYTAHSGPKSHVTLELKADVKKIRVKLDWGGGKLSFYDSDTYDHVHTFTHKFAVKVFPYLSNNCFCHTLEISPGEPPKSERERCLEHQLQRRGVHQALTLSHM
ncbi:hypothetical protein UPYG_G00209750 [Umbra pygmaea]|uniref:Tripartite motif-containing protein 35-like n=1 Tax=Umbra pygmaea TaxID=75934 RepID=A0ABD0X3J8_UMBPY